MSGSVLTRAEFIEALDAQLAQERADSIERFDHGAAIYGENVNLLEREWLQEAYEERLDERIYAMFDEIKEKRNLP